MDNRIQPACPFCTNDHNPDITCRVVAAIEGEIMESINSNKEMTLADAAEALFALEEDARIVANGIQKLAEDMEKLGLDPTSLLPAMIAVCAISAASGITGDISLAATAAKTVPA